jgi:hypothetical protein
LPTTEAITPTPSETPAPVRSPRPAPVSTPQASARPLIAGRALEAPDCEDGFTIDFAGLLPGTVVSEQYTSQGVHISGVANGPGFPNAVLLFDSDGSGSRDPDLEVDTGNIAILAANLKDDDGDGLIDRPDESNFGGKQVYAFDEPVEVGSLLFIDKDHGTPDNVIAYDAAGSVIDTVRIPKGGNGSVQEISIDASGVTRLVVDYRDSAGLTGIEVCPQEVGSTPAPASATPDPTASATATPSATPTLAPSPTPTALLALLPPTGGHLGAVAGLSGLALVIGSSLVLLAAGYFALRLIRLRP